MVEQCLREGYKPMGLGAGYNKARQAVPEAAHRLGVTRVSIATWAQNHRSQIDWSLYLPALSQPVETQTHRDMATTETRLRIRLSHARQSGPTETVKVCAIGDAHDHPDIPKDRARWMGKWVGDVKPDLVVRNTVSGHTHRAEVARVPSSGWMNGCCPSTWAAPCRTVMLKATSATALRAGGGVCGN